MTGEPMRRLVGNKWLRCGYTTGTCAAAAAKAAATMLLSGQLVESVTVQTPSGVTLTLDVLDARCDGVTASGAVRKDAGDDPDATDGALIYAHVERTATAAIVIDGGEGIGRVTKPGLDQPVGAAAINSVPRSMIEAAVHSAEAESIEVREMKIASISEPIEIHGRRKSETESNEACDRKRSDRTASVAELVKSEAASIDSAESPQSPELSGWRVVISCPTGAEIARKTFNPKLGIVKGISILGTTGIVEPMSNAALIETMAREISILAAADTKDLLVVIGNYGETFARDTLGLVSNGTSYGVVKSSNFIKDAITQAAEHSFERVLVVGHLGKFAKVGIGMLNTHSSQGDGRIETLIACALEAGADLDVLRQLLSCVSTDAATVVLAQANLLPQTMAMLERRIQATFDKHTPAGLCLEWICFTRNDGCFETVAQSSGSLELVRKWNQS